MQVSGMYLLGKERGPGQREQGGRKRRATTSSNTYKITNLRGRRDRTGNRVKQMTKQAAAARLQKAKTSRRSHRLTALQVSYLQPRGVASASHGPSEVWARAAMHMFPPPRGWGGPRCRRWDNVQVDSHTNQPSSSSRRLGAGSGAPGPSDVGRTVYPRSWNGFRFCSEASRPDDGCDVVMGASWRRLQPRELMESRKFADAMIRPRIDSPNFDSSSSTRSNTAELRVSLSLSVSNR